MIVGFFTVALVICLYFGHWAQQASAKQSAYFPEYRNHLSIMFSRNPFKKIMVLQNQPASKHLNPSQSDVVIDR